MSIVHDECKLYLSVLYCWTGEELVKEFHIIAAMCKKMRSVVIAVKPAITYSFLNCKQSIQGKSSIQKPFDSNSLYVKLLITAIAQNDLRTRESQENK